MKDMLRSPEAEAGGGAVVEPRACAEKAVVECGGLVAAIQWAESWAHRPYFAEVLAILHEQEAARESLVRTR